jgi:hypothetical protein
VLFYRRWTLRRDGRVARARAPRSNRIGNRSCLLGSFNCAPPSGFEAIVRIDPTHAQVRFAR